MLLDRATLDGIARGDIDVVFRRWRRPTVKTGGTLRSAIGMLAIDEVTIVDPAAISDEDARRAGFDTAADVVAFLDGRPGQAYRIAVRAGGTDPRTALQQQQSLTVADRGALQERLARLDRAAGQPWTEAILRLIERRPEVRAADLAAELGRDRDAFKVDVRKLKNLGLTISLERGYRLSPRGAAYLARRR